ncbi:hypothetical protein [Dactylosporangium sp. CA-092794]|uniref:hypothetical protein n=1 Tax=Dactylosporangium sp. CA-092794 TaxID=3239929 RepID=UPI003D8B2DE4
MVDLLIRDETAAGRAPGGWVVPGLPDTITAPGTGTAGRLARRRPSGARPPRPNAPGRARSAITSCTSGGCTPRVPAQGPEVSVICAARHRHQRFFMITER